MALHCRVHIISTTPTAAQRLVELLGAALELDTKGAWDPAAEAGIVQLGADTSLEVRALPSGLFAAARQLRFRRQPALSRLAGVAIEAAGAGLGAAAAAAPSTVVAPLSSVSPGWQEWQEWLSEARPRVTPALSVVSGGGREQQEQQQQQQQQPSPSLLREVVVGAAHTDLAGMAARLDGVGRPVAGRPNVFWLQPGSLALRLLPSTMSSLVLRAPTPMGVGGVAAVREHMERRGVAAHPIGLTGASAGQLLLSAPALDGLDVRISLAPEGEAPPVVFAEGDEVLRENVLEELNPSIDGPVHHHVGEGAAASVPAAHYQRTMGGIGDCWSEFRAQMKRPGGFMKK